MSQRSTNPASRTRAAPPVLLLLVFAVLLVLLQYRMDLAALLPGGPEYRPAVHGEVVLLATADCPWCARTRRYLARHDVPWREYDVGADPRGRELLAASGRLAVPVLLVGDEVVQGYDPLAIRAAFRRVAADARRTGAPPPAQKP